ncbi:MAG TPA: hypothetical protein VFB29_09885 [Pseudolabrys sp.]|nr:hypothetical protein [Pseudolabrys sp.]
MTGAGRIPLVAVEDIGRVLSGAGSRLATASGAGQALPTSYCIHPSGHMARAAAAFTIAIRGATPPPAG